MFKKIDPKQSFPKLEEEIIKFWEGNKTFEKSLESRKGSPLYTFYDGPPFATGTPHYGHLVGSTMKDAVPRYWTMKGFLVERKWGWDCHGLPIENIVEKELGSKAKKDIEKLGVEKFNELCRSKVLEYVEEWKVIIKRFGRWADMENSYKTMDLTFMESVWWVFKELWDKGLIYESYRSMHICPRCETTLSQSEVAEGYKNIKDLSATVKFELIYDPGTFILAWTTTPWTLIGNVALAIGEDIVYSKVESDNRKYIVAKDRLADVFKDTEYEVVEEFRGKALVGKEYKPLFDYYAKDEKLENRNNGWKIYGGDFVTTQEGTGIVHIAPAFGEDDMDMGKENNLPFIQHVGMDGVIKEEADEFAGLHVKPLEDTQKTDVEIIRYLGRNSLLFSKEKYEHSYPHCWRCETPLLNYATTSWFVSIAGIKDRMLELAEEINWSPKHIKEGRFGNWLEGARDWSISRQRFWASVIPVWRCECGETKVFGSVKELEELSGETITDIHKDTVDKIVIPCERCKGEMKRVPDVLDTWFDSGSMPYAQLHYPFENKDKFEKGFPAQFIAEGNDQTRAWFYYLHVIATGIKDSVAFKNVIVNGTVQAEDGKKMAKRLKNYPDPAYVIEKYGADALRFYLLTSPVMQAEDLNFKESEVADLVRGMFRMLWNSYSFFTLYANIDKFRPAAASKGQASRDNLLDKWIISELQLLIRGVDKDMENYELTRAARLFPKFIDNLSNWYIRRSRKRFWKSENDTDKRQAYETLYYVLVTLAKLMAPFTPFISEEIYKNLTDEESVHLTDYPKADEKLIDGKLNGEMARVRNIISEGLQLRAKNKIKVRQPLGKVTIKDEVSSGELLDIIKEELNVKEVVVDKKMETEIALDTEITEELLLEGVAREIIRSIQEMRKAAGYEVDNRIMIGYNGWSAIFENSELETMITKETLAQGILRGTMSDADLTKEFMIEGKEVVISIKR